MWRRIMAWMKLVRGQYDMHARGHGDEDVNRHIRGLEEAAAEHERRVSGLESRVRLIEIRQEMERPAHD